MQRSQVDWIGVLVGLVIFAEVPKVETPKRRMIMSIGRIGTNTGMITTGSTRTRETPPSNTNFKNFLNHGANVLLGGAQIASSLVGIPLLSGAISRARTSSDLPITSGDSNSSTLVNNGEELTNNLGGGEMSEDMKLLSLQNEIQKHNRQISLVSNIMKAKHETAKS